MNSAFTTKSDGTLEIAGELDIYSSEELRARLIQATTSPTGVRLDLSSVTNCDVTAMQLLCAARKSAIDAGKSFHLSAVSESVEAARVALGINAAEFSNSPSH